MSGCGSGFSCGSVGCSGSCSSLCLQGVLAAFLLRCRLGGLNGLGCPCGADGVAAVGFGHHRPHDFPHEGGELSCHGDLRFLPCLAARGELAPSLMQSILTAPGDFDDLTPVCFWDGLLSCGELLADLRRQAVVLGALIRSPPHGHPCGAACGSLFRPHARGLSSVWTSRPKYNSSLLI